MITDLLELVGRACHTADHDQRCARPFGSHSAAFGLTVDTDGRGNTERWCDACLLEDPRRALTINRINKCYAIGLGDVWLGQIIASTDGEVYQVVTLTDGRRRNVWADTLDAAVDMLCASWGWTDK